MIAVETLEVFPAAVSSELHRVRGGNPVIGRSAISYLIVALLLPLATGSARAQARPSSGGMTASAYGGVFESPAPSPSASQGQNPFSGSVPAKPVPGVLRLSLQEAIDRGLKQNLGLLLSGENVRAARGQRWQFLSELLPNVNTSTYIADSQIDLAEFGFTFSAPGFQVPSVVGPFAYFDSRAYLTQSVFDWKAINRTRAAGESLKSAQGTFKDARDLVILAVGYSYLQAVADEARVETTGAQVTTAEALYNQAEDRVKAGTSPAIDALRAQVELKSQQQQLIQAKNDFAIEKLKLARAVGLAPGQQFDLSDKSPYQPFPGLTIDEALKRAYESRSDFQAALANLRAAEYARKAAGAGYLPSLSFTADYGLAGTYPNVSTHGVFDVRGTLVIPIFQGGRVHGDVLEADARLEQSRQRLENLRAQIDAEVRTALLNLQSAEERVSVAQSDIDLAEQTLVQARDRFTAGVTDTIEVVQAQEAVTRAHESYIASLYSDNYAKISLARAPGQAEEGVKEYFRGK